MKPGPPPTTREQIRRLQDEFPGAVVVIGWSADYRLPPIYAGISDFGFNIAYGRGQTVDEAIDGCVRRNDAWRRERRLEISPLEWWV
jgi:hypothetical protein